MKKTVFILGLLIGLMGFSQKDYTISGYVKEQATGEELLGVNIILGEFTGTMTNEYGFYSITVPQGTYELKISYLGFKSVSQQIVLDKDIQLNFELEEESNQLDQVVITTNKQKQTASVRSTEMSVVQLSSRAVKKLPITLGEPDVIRFATAASWSF